MFTHRRCVMRLFLSVLVCGLWFGTTTAAEPKRASSTQLLPKETLAYVRIASVPDLVERFHSTALGQMIKDPKLAPLVGQLYSSAAEALVTVKDQVGVSIDEMATMFQGEVTLAVVANQGSRPILVAIIDAGDRLPIAQKLLDRGAQALEQQAGATKEVQTVGETKLTVFEFAGGGQSRQVVQFEKGGTIVLSNHVDFAKQLLADWNGGGGDSLTNNQQFAAIMKTCRGSKDEPPQITWFVDPLALVRQLSQGNIGAQAGLALLPALGLDGLQGVGGSIALASGEFDSVMHAHLLLDNPRAGVLELLTLGSGDTTPQRWVPADVASYDTLRWDFGETYARLEKLLDSFQGAGATANMVNAPASSFLGVDLASELLPALEGRVTHINLFDHPATVAGAATLVAIQLKDAEAFQPSLDKLLKKFEANLEKKSYGGVTYYEAKTSFNPAQPDQHACLAVMDNCLMLCDRVSILQKVIATNGDASRSLASALDYKLIASKILREAGATKPGMLNFNRPEESMRFVYELATADSSQQWLRKQGENNKAFKALSQSLESNPLPPFAVLAQYLSPGGSLVTNDETGFHYMAFSLKRK